LVRSPPPLPAFFVSGKDLPVLRVGIRGNKKRSLVGSWIRKSRGTGGKPLFLLASCLLPGFSLHRCRFADQLPLFKAHTDSFSTRTADLYPVNLEIKCVKALTPLPFRLL